MDPEPEYPNQILSLGDHISLTFPYPVDFFETVAELKVSELKWIIPLGLKGFDELL